MDFEQWKEVIFENIETIGKGLDKDDDWTPVIIFKNDRERQGGVIVLVGMEGQEGLPAVTAALTEIRPTTIARIEMGWAANYEEGNTARPADRPDKKEVLTVQFAESGRDGRHELWWADVDRSGDHPKLVNWDQPESFGGVVAEATRMSMKTMDARLV